MRTLSCCVESRAAARSVEIANGVSRLHRVDDNAVVDEFESDNPRGSRECGVGRLGIAHIIVPVEDDVAGNVVEKLRCTGTDRILSLGYCWEWIVLDMDRFSGIPRCGQSFGYDKRDWLTDVPHLAESKHGARSVVPRRAVTIDQGHHAGDVAEPVCPNVFSGSRKKHARHAPSRGCVDALDMRVRYGRAQHEGMRHSG